MDEIKLAIWISAASGIWLALIVAAILITLVLVFVSQNGQDVTVKFLGFDRQVPLGVAIMVSAVAGVFSVALPGSVRVIQLRRALWRTGRESCIS